MRAQTKTLPALRAWRNFQKRVTFEGRHAQLAAQRRLPRRQFHLVDQIVSFNREIRMTRQAHAQKKIAAFSPAGARFALARKPDALSLVHAFRDLDLITFQLV